MSESTAVNGRVVGWDEEGGLEKERSGLMLSLFPLYTIFAIGWGTFFKVMFIFAAAVFKKIGGKKTLGG